jgi:hypothetical protein
MTTTLQKKSELLLERMQDGGIKQNCQDYRQYVKAKKLVEDLSSTPDEFEALVHIVIDYVGI